MVEIERRTFAEVVGYYASLLEFAQTYQRVPAVQAAVYLDGGIAMSAAFGQADVESGTALTERHLFRIASHSKTFTATAVLQLREAGRLRLDDRADDHVTALAGTPIGAVTVRDLLSHTAGVSRDAADGDFWQLGAEFPDADGLHQLLTADRAMVLPANERFKYSNLGYSLLGLVVEAASGRGYADYVRDEIIARLGVADLGPELEPSRHGQAVTGYTSLAYAQTRTPIDHTSSRAMASATGFYATAQDLVRYFAAHLPGDDTLLSDESKRLMQHAAWQTKPDDPDQRYGLGFDVTKIGDTELFGHGGGYPGHITRTLVDPGRRYVVSVLTNAIDGPAQQLAELLPRLLDLATSEERPGETEIDPSRFTGRFADLWGVVDVALLGGRLYALSPSLADPTDQAVPLEVVDEHTLRVTGGSGYGWYGEPYLYDFDDDGSVRSLRGTSGHTRWPLESYTLPERVTVRSADPELRDESALVEVDEPAASDPTPQ